MAPSLRNVASVGNNGIPLDSNAFVSALHVPDNYDLFDLQEQSAGFSCSSQQDIARQLRFFAFNDIPPHGFSIGVDGVRERLRRIEENWVKGMSASGIDTAFWDACYERQNQPRSFQVRDKYIDMAADEIFMLSIDTKCKVETLIHMTMVEIADLSLAKSPGDPADSDIREASAHNPSMPQVLGSIHSRKKAIPRKRPPTSARVPSAKQYQVSADTSSRKRSRPASPIEDEPAPTTSKDPTTPPALSRRKRVKNSQNLSSAISPTSSFTKLLPTPKEVHGMKRGNRNIRLSHTDVNNVQKKMSGLSMEEAKGMTFGTLKNGQPQNTRWDDADEK